MKKRNLVLFLIPFILTGCSNQELIQEEPIDFASSTITELLTKLNKVENYTIIVNDTHYYKTTGNISIYDKVYYNSLAGYGYIESDDGVYEISVTDDNEIVGGELVKENESTVKHLKGSNLYTNLSVFDLSYFDEGTEVSLKDNKTRLAYLSLLNIDSKEAINVTSFDAYLDVENDYRLIFSMQFNDNSYINSTITYYNETKNQNVQNFLTLGGTYFTPEEDWITMRDLFKNDNYSRLVYDNQADGTSVEVGREYYTKNYFGTLYHPTTSYLLYSDCYFSIPDADFTAIYTKDGAEIARESKHFNGVYKTVVGYDYEKSEYTFQPYFGSAISDYSSDVTEVLNYPKNLLMFDYLEYFSYNDVDKVYYSTDYGLAASLYLNFQLYQIIDINEIDLVGSGFDYTINKDDPSKSEVGIYLYIMYQGQYTYFDFHFTNFGTTSIPFMDEMCSTLTYYKEV